MSEFKVLIVEDKEYNLKGLLYRLEENRYTQQLFFNAHIASSYNTAYSLLRENVYDIVFFDYILDRKDCFALLEEFAKQKFKIVIITSQYERGNTPGLDEGLKKYEPNCIWIKGPCNSKAIHKLEFEIRDRLSELYSIKHEGTIKSLKLAHIAYIESADDYVIYSVQTIREIQKFIEKNTLKHLAEGLRIHQFVRCSNQCIVNAKYVCDYFLDKKGDGGTLILKIGEEQIEIKYSNHFKENLQQAGCFNRKFPSPESTD